jgi:hypothetical protein
MFFLCPILLHMQNLQKIGNSASPLLAGFLLMLE